MLVYVIFRYACNHVKQVMHCSISKLLKSLLYHLIVHWIYGVCTANCCLSASEKRQRGQRQNHDAVIIIIAISIGEGPSRGEAIWIVNYSSLWPLPLSIMSYTWLLVAWLVSYKNLNIQIFLSLTISISNHCSQIKIQLVFLVAYTKITASLQIMDILQHWHTVFLRLCVLLWAV